MVICFTVGQQDQKFGYLREIFMVGEDVHPAFGDSQTTHRPVCVYPVSVWCLPIGGADDFHLVSWIPIVHIQLIL